MTNAELLAELRTRIADFRIRVKSKPANAGIESVIQVRLVDAYDDANGVHIATI